MRDVVEEKGKELEIVFGLDGCMWGKKTQRETNERLLRNNTTN